MGDEIGAAELALERLFRLTVNRKMHTRQTAAVGSDVTRAGYALLRCLNDGGELSLGHLARECSMDPAATGRQVRALEEEGLVARMPAGGDGRVIAVRLTDRGRDVYGRIVAVRTTHMNEVLASWSMAERAELARLVDRLVDDLKSVPFRPGPNYKGAL